MLRYIYKSQIYVFDHSTVDIICVRLSMQIIDVRRYDPVHCNYHYCKSYTVARQQTLLDFNV